MNQYKSLNLAALWNGLEKIRREIINDLLPIANHLAIEDPELMVVMEVMVEKIDKHFETFRLQAVRKEDQK